MIKTFKFEKDEPVYVNSKYLQQDKNKMYYDGTITLISDKISVKVENKILTLDHKYIHKKSNNPKDFSRHHLTDLTINNYPSIIKLLKYQYSRDIYYLQLGSKLIFINPHTNNNHQNEDVNVFIKPFSLPQFSADYLNPHIYTLAVKTYANIKDTQNSTLIIPLGLSNSGKTQIIKGGIHVLAQINDYYINKECSIKNNHKEISSTKIYSAMNIIEAISNVKSEKSKNNTKAINLYKIYYNENSNRINSFKVMNYYLERNILKNERENNSNFNILYYFFDYLDINQKVPLYLNQNFEKYKSLKHYSNPSAYYYKSYDNLTNKQKFEQIIWDMDILGFTPAIKSALFKCLTAILHVGNLTIEKNEDYLDLDENSLEIICKILSIDPVMLKDYLLYDNKKIGKTNVSKVPKKHQDVQQNIYLFSKEIYSILYNFIIYFINTSLTVNQFCSDLNIAHLDYCGFDSNELNDLDQLVINYSNEYFLYQYFQSVYCVEKKLLFSEGLGAYIQDVHLESNKEIIDYLNNPKICIFNAIKSNSYISKVVVNSSSNSTDKVLINILNIDQSAKYIQEAENSNGQVSKNSFVVRHTYDYFSTYSTTGFIECNKFNVGTNYIALLMNSSDPEIAKIANETIDTVYDSEVERKSKEIQSVNEKDLFLISKFQYAMNRLNLDMDGYENKQYVICLSSKLEGEKQFCEPLVYFQSELFKFREMIEIYTNGFPVMVLFDDFIREFKLLHPKWYNYTEQYVNCASENELKKIVFLLMNMYNIGSDNVLFGNKYLFMKETSSNQLKAIKNKKMIVYVRTAVLIQSYARMYKVKKKYKEDFIKLNLVQKIVKKFLYRKRTLKIVEAISKIRNFGRSILYRNRFLKIKKSVNKIASTYKGYIQRLKYEKTLIAIFKIQRYYTNYTRHVKPYKTYMDNRKTVFRIIDTVIYQKVTIVFIQMAIKLQKVARGFLFRRNNMDLMNYLNKRRNKIRLYFSAVQIQKLVRGVLTRSAIKHWNHAAITIQRYFKTVWSRTSFLLIRESVHVIQRNVRKFLLKKNAKAYFLDEYFSEANDEIDRIQREEYSYHYNDPYFIQDRNYKKRVNIKNDLNFQHYLNKAEFYVKIIDIEVIGNTKEIYDVNFSSEFVKSMKLSKNKIISLKVGDSHVLMLGTSGKAYTYGMNDYLQCGNGTQFNYCSPQELVFDDATYTSHVKFPKDISPRGQPEKWQYYKKSICQIATGHDHSLLIDADKNLYVAGRNDRLQLLEDSEENQVQLKKANKHDRAQVKSIATNGHTTYLLYSDNTIVSNYIRTLVKFTLKPTIKLISCGRGFVMALSDSGLVFAQGQNNEYGQLGLRHAQPSRKFVPVEFRKDEYNKEAEVVVHLACGERHSIALSNKSQVFTWGCNSHGQLGLGHYHHHWHPVRNGKLDQKLHRLVQVSASYAASYLLSDDGEVQVAGSNSKFKKQKLFTGMDFNNMLDYYNVPYYNKFNEMVTNKLRAVKLGSTWSRTLSITYAVLLDCTNTDIDWSRFKNSVKEVSSGWKHPSDIEPYVSSLIKKYYKNEYISKEANDKAKGNKYNLQGINQVLKK